MYLLHGILWGSCLGMNDKRKIIIEITAFVLVFVLAFSCCYNVLRIKDIGNGGGIEAYDDIKVPVDVAIFGASHSVCTVDNSILWKDYGIASYTLWSGSQEVDGTYLFMQDAFKKNKPKVALVETLDFINYSNPDRTLSLSALTTDYSKDYVNWAIKTASDQGYSREYLEEMLFRMPIVHSRYKELAKTDFIQERTYNRGYNGSNECLPCEPPTIVDDREDVPEIDMYYINKIIELCKEYDVELVFFHAPFVLDDANIFEQKRQNYLSDYFAENGIPFLDYYRNYESCGIDFATDLREGNHLNDLGATKVTNALGQYLVSNYEFADKAGKAGYEDWDTHVRYVEDRKITFNLKKIDDLGDYLKSLSGYTDRFTIIVSFNGNYKVIEGYDGIPDFASMGLGTEYDVGGLAVIRNGKVDVSTEGSAEYNVYREFDGRVDFVGFKSADDLFEGYMINGNDYTKDCNGFGITVYDETCHYIVDDVYVDVYEGTEVHHVSEDYVIY